LQGGFWVKQRSTFITGWVIAQTAEQEIPVMHFPMHPMMQPL
jgi:hypothetical protein